MLPHIGADFHKKNTRYCEIVGNVFVYCSVQQEVHIFV